MLKYKVFTYDELTEEHIQFIPWITNGWYDETNCLFLMENDRPIKLIATDGGEPEDNSFIRDWAWVEGELNTALEMNND
jgi:hypothetical protein